jgi:hypothetical protein
MGDEDLAYVRVRYVDGPDLPDSEGLWAKPVEAHDGGGTYRLENNAFMVSLAAGDVVRAELDGRGQLQVVDIVEPSPALVTVVEVNEGVPEDTVTQAIERWSEHGARWTEGTAGYLTTVWADELPEDAVMAVVEPDLDSTFTPISKAGPLDRTRDALVEIDYELDRTPPDEVHTDYWAADDPVWKELGYGDPEFLAYVQRLAGDDARVARALEKGRHDQVLTFIQRINAPDPRELPPLDGPIFDE